MPPTVVDTVRVYPIPRHSVQTPVDTANQFIIQHTIVRACVDTVMSILTPRQIVQESVDTVVLPITPRQTVQSVDTVFLPVTPRQPVRDSVESVVLPPLTLRETVHWIGAISRRRITIGKPRRRRKRGGIGKIRNAGAAALVQVSQHKQCLLTTRKSCVRM